MKQRTRLFFILVSASVGLLFGEGCAEEPTSPLVIAHRGLAHTHPDNSLAALLEASDAGADAVETDLQLDGDEVVLSHEADRSCRQRSPDALRDFLEEEDGRYDWLFLEIKGTDDNRSELARRAVEICEEFGVLDRVVFTSFHVDGIDAVRRAADDFGVRHVFVGLKLFFDFGTGISAGCTPTAPRGSEADAHVMDVDWVLWPATTIDAIDVELAQAKGRKVATWSGETPDLMHRSVGLDVDGIYTDAPEYTRGLVGD